MLDYTLDALLVAHLKSAPALAALHSYTGQDNSVHKLPAFTVSTNSEPLAGSDVVFRGEVRITIESEAHDATPELHAERVESIWAALANRHAVMTVLNASGSLHIYGYAPLGSDPTAADGRFATTLKYRFGFGPA